MKTKIDLVTNSSSTGHILGRIKKSDEPFKINIEIDISKMGEVIDKVEDLYKIDYFRYCLEDEIIPLDKMDTWEKEKYLECKRIIEEGGCVYYFQVSNESDDPISQMIYDRGIKKEELNDKNFVIIMGD